MQVLSTGNIQTLDQIELTQTEDEPPRGQGHSEDYPNRDQGDG